MQIRREQLAHLSFEFFPPKTPRDKSNLLRAAGRLQAFSPDFYSVTHGAGASSREGTLDTVRLLLEGGFKAVPHVSWGDDSESEIVNLVRRYDEMGVDEMVLLRGDRAPGDQTSVPGRYGANLVELVRSEFKDRFKINVACYPEFHPEAQSFQLDMGYLADKVNAGADRCITQYFFNLAAYDQFLELCKQRSIDAPIVPGLMPITNYSKLVSFSEKCGADIPRWLDVRLFDLKDDPDTLREFGTQVLTTLLEKLLRQGIPGVHFYTLNLSRPTVAILNRLLDVD